jgi:hypothetical protein
MEGNGRDRLRQRAVVERDRRRSSDDDADHTADADC